MTPTLQSVSFARRNSTDSRNIAGAAWSVFHEKMNSPSAPQEITLGCSPDTWDWAGDPERNIMAKRLRYSGGSAAMNSSALVTWCRSRKRWIRG